MPFSRVNVNGALCSLREMENHGLTVGTDYLQLLSWLRLRVDAAVVYHDSNGVTGKARITILYVHLVGCITYLMNGM